LVDTVNGDEWFVHFQDRGMYGRIVHLQPVSWVDGWAVMGENASDYCGEPVAVYKKPNVVPVDAGKGMSGECAEEVCYLEASDDFASEKLNLMWQWLGNPKEEFYSLTANPNHLRLYCKNPTGAAEPILWDNANVLTQKLVCPHFRAESCLRISGLLEKEQAGMVMMGGDYAYLGVRMTGGVKSLILSQSADKKDGAIKANGQSTEKEETITTLAALAREQEKVWLVFEIREMEQTTVFLMKYSLDGENYVDVPVDFMPSDHTWVGAKIGLFATVLGAEAGGYADFEYIHVEALV